MTTLGKGAAAGGERAGGPANWKNCAPRGRRWRGNGGARRGMPSSRGKYPARPGRIMPWRGERATGGTERSDPNRTTMGGGKGRGRGRGGGGDDRRRIRRTRDQPVVRDSRLPRRADAPAEQDSRPRDRPQEEECRVRVAPIIAGFHV
jgi:hypothetical protein